MELAVGNAVVLSLVFFLGAAVGALLNAIWRASKIEKIKAEFVGQLEEQIAIREAQTTNHTGPTWWSESSGTLSKAPMNVHRHSGEKQAS